MAAILAVAIVVIAVAPDTNGDGKGTFDDPNYIIGDKSKAVDIGDGISTEIKFNANSFVASPSFKVYTKNEAEEETNGVGGGTPIGTDKTATVSGYKFIINKVGESTGIYKIEIVTDVALTKSVFKIGVSITEEWEEGLTTTQKYFWGVNIEAQCVGAKITLKENNTKLTTGDSSTNAYPINFEKKVDISIETGTNGKFYYYATGLPEGISVTTDGRIAGMLSKSETSREGSFKITAVNGNKVLEKIVHYEIEGALTGGDLTFKIGDKPTPKYVLVNNGENVKVTDFAIDGNTFDKTYLKITSSPDLGTIQIETDDKGKDVLLIETGSLGLGSFRIDMTYKAPDSKTITKSFQVFVVGGIFDSNIDPTVQGKVNG